MKKLFFVLMLLSVACVVNAQETLSKSKTLVGIWQQVVPMKVDDKGTDDSIQFLPTGNYKIYNVDNTFLLFILNPKGFVYITVYGTYNMTKDGEFEEHITHHSSASAMVGSKSDLRYKIRDNSIATIEYFNSSAKMWVPEVWKRVDTLPVNPPAYEKTM